MKNLGGIRITDHFSVVLAAQPGLDLGLALR